MAMGTIWISYLVSSISCNWEVGAERKISMAGTSTLFITARGHDVDYCTQESRLQLQLQDHSPPHHKFTTPA